MNILQQYLANRASHGKQPKNPLVNDAPQVTRAEFNTLVRAVEGLVDDLAAATSPDKLQALFTNAVAALPQAPTTHANAKHGLGGRFTAPTGDDDASEIQNSAVRNRASPGFTAPKGDD